jgi:hypothetical protein
MMVRFIMIWLVLTAPLMVLVAPVIWDAVRRLPRPVSILLAFVVWAVAFGAMGQWAMASAHPFGKPVALSDAEVPPAVLEYVRPGQAVTFTRQCGRHGYFGDISAYRWDGSPLRGQRWNRTRDRIMWGDPYGGFVMFDGIKVTNRTTAPVLFGGWCG